MKDLTDDEVTIVVAALDNLRSRNDTILSEPSSDSSLMNYFSNQNIDIESLIKKLVS